MPVCRLRMTASPARSEETWSLAATTTEVIEIARGASVEAMTPPRCVASLEGAPGPVADLCCPGGYPSSEAAEQRRAPWGQQREAEFGARGLFDEQATAAADGIRSPDRARLATSLDAK